MALTFTEDTMKLLGTTAVQLRRAQDDAKNAVEKWAALVDIEQDFIALQHLKTIRDNLRDVYKCVTAAEDDTDNAVGVLSNRYYIIRDWLENNNKLGGGAPTHHL